MDLIGLFGLILVSFDLLVNSCLIDYGEFVLQIILTPSGHTVAWAAQR